MYSRQVRFKKGQAGGPRRAIALGYDADHDLAPRVLAAGSGLLAEKIIALAQANGIPLREDPALASALAGLKVDDLIPPELYAVVAEILAFVYRIHQPRAPQPPEPE